MLERLSMDELFRIRCRVADVLQDEFGFSVLECNEFFNTAFVE